MKLYYSPGACSLAAHIVAKETGQHLDLVNVDLATHKTADGLDYRSINPRGYVPALDIGESEPLTEASAVVQYLAERKPESGLMPAAGTSDRVRVQQWLAFIATEIHMGISPLWNPKLPAEAKAIVTAKLHRRLKELDQRLAGKPFLTGERFSAADAYAFTVLNWTSFLKMDLAPYPNIAAYLKRVAERPAVRAALQAEGLV